MHRPLALAALLLAACGAEPDAPRPAGADTLAAVPANAPASTAWRSNPEEGVTIRPGDAVTVETGPHTLLWPADAAELAPPYTVRATLLKRAGRIHEGYGLFFGGSQIEGAEEAQAYSYFLVRGDGSFLVKRREGPDTPTLRDWTRHPRINRDANGATRPNELEVQVRPDTAVFLVNGAEVARVPTDSLSASGGAGVRVAHDVVLEIGSFQAEPGAP